MRAKTNRAQSVLEYAMLFLAVAAAFTGMSLYLQRAINYKLYEIRQELSPGIPVINKTS